MKEIQPQSHHQDQNGTSQVHQIENADGTGPQSSSNDLSGDYGGGLDLGISLQTEKPESFYQASRPINAHGLNGEISREGAAEFNKRQKISQDLHGGERIEVAITIFQSADVVYSYWRDFKNIPKFMKHVVQLEVETENRIRWHWKTLAGFELQWHAEMIDDVADKLISWKTTPGSAVQNAGSVWFRPILDGQATEVYLRVMYHIPGGRLTTALAELFGESPQQVLKDDLKRLRCLIESGGVEEESFIDVVGLGLSDPNVDIVIPPIH